MTSKALPLFKTTIIIWSDSDPCQRGIADLARAAESGDAYCSQKATVAVADPQSDPDWDGTDFFGPRAVPDHVAVAGAQSPDTGVAPIAIQDAHGGWWGQHPDYPLADWMHEVTEGDTRRGYWDWVSEKVEADRG
ncbi:hypothetical protein E4T66_17145 [Sinimarinibacterium sp. CAU 1509]|uniref:hypothetical protein n=1 Tax=Sinimarinibacterium sp. CAU 1509 TaxID=2562283 RepID=UPI0010AD1B40|nr:hypothetical protein [Sinimarinibacterium sp. CAU 1509]TJY57137.1 hypothetical protein E4T66_17145 [Sinimarinibacterium sp. CAU 1509]